jgi:hypothetical protein
MSFQPISRSNSSRQETKTHTVRETGAFAERGTKEAKHFELLATFGFGLKEP